MPPGLRLFPLEDAPVEDGLSGVLVHKAEVGGVVGHLPDLGLDRSAGQQGAGHLGGHPGGALRLAGDELVDHHAAGKAKGAQALDDGLVELHVLGVLRVHVDEVGVAGEAVEEVLHLGDIVVHGIVGVGMGLPPKPPASWKKVVE